MVNIKVGIIGYSEGNGHPFSMSCIINGYNDAELKNSGWNVIYNYIKLRDESEFTFPNVQITHVWTQEKEISFAIAKSANIANICDSFLDMLGKVDAVIIARDDYESHFEIAKPFLQSGTFVFIDKPLSLNEDELKFFYPYLNDAQLMSCSGMRYAKELDYIRNNLSSLGEIKLIRGAVLNNFEKYGVHMLDAIFGCIPMNVASVCSVKSNHDSAILYCTDGSIIQIDALGNVGKTFQIDFFGSNSRHNVELEDNFSAFRRTLFHFFKLIRSRKPSIDPQNTITIMKIIIAYKKSCQTNHIVKLDEICLDKKIK